MNSLFKYAQGSKPGKKANAYKDNNVSYSAKHKRQSKKGKADKCTKCGSTKNLVWAEKHGTNGKEHMTLCTSCHAKYDGFADNINKRSSLEAFIKAAAMLTDLIKESSTTACTGAPIKGVSTAPPADAGTNAGFNIDPEKTESFYNQHPKFKGYSFGNLNDSDDKSQKEQNNIGLGSQQGMYGGNYTPQIGKGLPG